MSEAIGFINTTAQMQCTHRGGRGGGGEEKKGRKRKKKV